MWLIWVFSLSGFLIGGYALYQWGKSRGQQVEQMKNEKRTQQTLQKMAVIRDRLQYDRGFIKRVRDRFTR